MVRKISESGGKNKKMGANPHGKNRSSTEILKKSARAKNKIWRRLGRGRRSADTLKNFALTPLALQKEIKYLKNSLPKSLTFSKIEFIIILSVAVGVAKYYLYTFIEKNRVTVNIN